MSHPKINYLVTQNDESMLNGSRTSIPTYGLPASSFDAYRTVGIHSIENKPVSWCFTDTDAAGALGRIIDGPIISHLDIEHAESALRGILLNDYLQVLVPCLKAEHENGFISYIRLDKNERNEAAYRALQVAPAGDLLFASEFVHVSNKTINRSTNQTSVFNGIDLDRISEGYRSLLQSTSQRVCAYSIELGAATYFANNELSSSLSGGTAGFIDEIYKRIYHSWIDVAQSTPPLNIEVKLPPLLAIVLSRSPQRENIPEILSELREELAEARLELNRMNEMLDKTMSQADIQAQIRKINESFDAIVPEALLTDAERRLRLITSVFNFTRPIKKIYSAISDPLSIDMAKVEEIFSLAHNAVIKDSRIISRNVPASKMSDLLRVDSIRESIKTHFTDSEIKLLIYK